MDEFNFDKGAVDKFHVFPSVINTLVIKLLTSN